MQFLQLALDDPDPSAVRPLLGLRRPAAGPGAAAVGADDRGGAPLLPGPGRDRRAAQDVGQRAARQEGQDRLPRRGPGDGVRGRSRLVGGAGRAVAAGRRGAAGGAGGRGRGAEALVEDLAAADRGGGDAVAALPACWSPRWPPMSPGSAGCRWSRRSPCPGRRRPRTPRRVCGRVICWPGRRCIPGVGLQGPVLLVDDKIRTRWTVTVAGSLLAEAGASTVLPLALHQLP